MDYGNIYINRERDMCSICKEQYIEAKKLFKEGKWKGKPPVDGNGFYGEFCDKECRYHKFGEKFWSKITNLPYSTPQKEKSRFSSKKDKREKKYENNKEKKRGIRRR